MKKMLVIGLCVLSGFSLRATTIIFNSTGTDVELKVSYSENCIIEGYDNSNPRLAEFKVTLPDKTKMDISGNLAQGRQKFGCYKDIVSIKATINLNDDTARISRTWQSNFNSKPSWVLRSDRLKGIVLQ